MREPHNPQPCLSQQLSSASDEHLMSHDEPRCQMDFFVFLDSARYETPKNAIKKKTL
jgi:hypothetical protein